MKWREDSQFADTVVRECLNLYTRLPKSGKPLPDKQWTLVAAVVVTFQTENSYETEVVAMGTGSKCIGQSKMSKTGEIINDSHAEVLARRAFLCYLYDELIKTYSRQESRIFYITDSDFKCRLREDIEFHFYSSQTPCGDASIFPKEDNSSPSSLADDKCDIGEPVFSSFVSGSLHETVSEKRKHTEDPSSLDISKKKIKELDSNDEKEESSVRSPDCYVEEMTFSYKKTNSVTDFCEASKINVGNSIYTREHGQNKSKEKQCVLNSEVLRNSSRESNLKHNFDSRTEGTCDILSSSQTINTSKDSLHSSKEDMLSTSSIDNMNIPTKTDNDSKDIYRTGAKCLPGGAQDPEEGGATYHTVGAFRIKPGRGERTLSMSCSDKMARWNVLGCQGALLLHFLYHPIYYQSVIIGRCPYNEDALHRALVLRSTGIEDTGLAGAGFKLDSPRLYQSNMEFCNGKQALMDRNIQEKMEVKIVPSATALIWYKGHEGSRSQEVSVNGRRQGITAKNQHKPEARSSVCSYELFARFHHILEILEPDRLPESLRNKDLRTYKDYKMSSSQYQENWSRLLTVYKTWSHKPDGYLNYNL